MSLFNPADLRATLKRSTLSRSRRSVRHIFCRSLREPRESRELLFSKALFDSRRIRAADRQECRGIGVETAIRVSIEPEKSFATLSGAPHALRGAAVCVLSIAIGRDRTRSISQKIYTISTYRWPTVERA